MWGLCLWLDPTNKEELIEWLCKKLQLKAEVNVNLDGHLFDKDYSERYYLQHCVSVCPSS